jgi:hypothetical protein
MQERVATKLRVMITAEGGTGPMPEQHDPPTPRKVSVLQEISR